MQIVETNGWAGCWAQCFAMAAYGVGGGGKQHQCQVRIGRRLGGPLLVLK